MKIRIKFTPLLVTVLLTLTYKLNAQVKLTPVINFSEELPKVLLGNSEDIKSVKLSLSNVCVDTKCYSGEHLHILEIDNYTKDQNEEWMYRMIKHDAVFYIICCYKYCDIETCANEGFKFELNILGKCKDCICREVQLTSR